MSAVNLRNLVLVVLAQTDGYTLTAQDLMARTGATGPQIKGPVAELKAEGLIGQNGNEFFLTQPGLDFYTEQGLGEEGGGEDDAFAEAAPAAVPAKAGGKAAGKKGAAPAAPAPVKAAAAPAVAPAKAGGKKAAAAPAKAGGAKKAAPAVAEDGEDEGFTMTYTQLDKLPDADLGERIEVARSAAEANFNTGVRENQLVAECLMRWVARAERHLNKRHAADNE